MASLVPHDSTRTTSLNWTTLKTHAARLGITTAMLQQCQTVAALQTIAKHQYHLLMHQHHPDAKTRNRALRDIPSPSEPTKQCSKCHLRKPFRAFTARRSTPTTPAWITKDTVGVYHNATQAEIVLGRQLQGHCKQCTALERQQRHQAHPKEQTFIVSNLTTSYDWIMALDGTAKLTFKPREKKLPPLPILEADLPWVLERKQPALGYGWQEDLNRYRY